jgi:iron complex outermembrane receptor protein
MADARLRAPARGMAHAGAAMTRRATGRDQSGPMSGLAVPTTFQKSTKMNRTSCAALSALALGPCAVAQAQSPQPAQLQSVVVTGKSLPEQAKELKAEQAVTPGGVTLVDGEELRQRNVTSLTDMLRYVPGLWAASGSTGDSSFLSSRGSNLDATNYDGNGIKMLQDGLPVTAADGSNHNRDVDPLSARYVIVARGANALTYGASTLGGAIDFITPTARDGAANELLLNGGSFGQRQGRLTLGTVAGGFDGLVTVEGKRSDGYREHMRQERTGLYANAGWQFGDAVKTRFYATAIDNDQQLPGALTRDEWRANPRQAQAAAVAGDYQYNVKTWRLANKTTWTLDGSSSLTAGLSYEQQQLYHPIVYAPPFFSLLIDTELRNLGGTLRYQRRIGEHDLLAGLNVGRTTVAGGNFSYVPNGTATLATQVDNQADNTELFVMDRWQFAPDWTAVYGGQAVSGSREVRNVTVSTGALRNPKADYDSFNPRVGLIHQLTPAVQLFANLSRLHEAPTLYELEDDVRGNGSTLDAMRGSVVEIGTRGAYEAGRNRWHWDVAVYYARLRGEILSRDDPNAPGTSLSTNVDDTVHAGVEALLGASLLLDESGTHRIEPLVSLTLNEFRFKGDRTYGNNRLPAAPRHAIKGELLYRHASGFFVGPTFDVVGRRYADFSNTYTVDAYTLWGLRAGLASKKWELYAEARNLADRNYVSQFSVRDTAAANAAILTPGEPRSLYVGARLKF